MNSGDWDEIIVQAGQAASIARTVFKDLTGEEFDLESGIRHYPLVALGLAAAAGAAGGWWFTRGSRPQLPPPAVAPPEPGVFSEPLAFIEDVLPGALDRVRDALPEVSVPSEVRERALGWLNSVGEKQLRKNFGEFTESVDTKLSGLLKNAWPGGEDSSPPPVDPES